MPFIINSTDSENKNQEEVEIELDTENKILDLQHLTVPDSQLKKKNSVPVKEI